MEKLREITTGKWGRLVLVTAGVYVVMRFLLPLIYPFVLAALLVIPLYPWLKRVERHTHIGKGFLTSGLLFFLGSLIILLVWLVVAWSSRHVTEFARGLEIFEENFNLFVTDCCEFVEGKTGFCADELETVIVERVNVFIEEFQVNVVPKLMKQSVGWFKAVINVAAGIMITFISAVLLAKDYEPMSERIRQLEGYEKISGIISSIGHLAGTFLRAQIIIMTCISILAVTGLWLSRVENPIFFGITAGIMDALPFIGTGIVLMPLAFWQLVQGRYVQAAACVILYTVCALLRELLEPRLIGGRMGLYPIVVLAAVYVGVKLYGLGGVILGPLSLLLIMEIMGSLNEK
ncbi:MAG: AI-2E family transporter [Clostridiales bacterium]|nr:AI-2E family transporter [Clostridiales bacterium]